MLISKISSKHSLTRSFADCLRLFRATKAESRGCDRGCDRGCTAPGTQNTTFSPAAHKTWSLLTLASTQRRLSGSSCSGGNVFVFSVVSVCVSLTTDEFVWERRGQGRYRGPISRSGAMFAPHRVNGTVTLKVVRCDLILEMPIF